VVWLFVGFAGLMCFFLCSFLKSPQIVSQSWNQRNQQWCQCNLPRVETSCWVDFLRTCQLFDELYYVIPIGSIVTSPLVMIITNLVISQFAMENPPIFKNGSSHLFQWAIYTVAMLVITRGYIHINPMINHYSPMISHY
jgi:hypothetical protein